MNEHSIEPVCILMVEDNPDDVELTRQTIRETKLRNNLHVVEDGVAALAFLRREGTYSDSPRPDLVLLDLNLPRKNGLEVLEEIKADDDLKRIPVIVLTASDDEADVLAAYNHNSNAYITKPVDLEQFARIVQMIDDFWMSIVKLPPK